MKATYGAFLTSEQMRPWIERGETERYVKAMLANILVAEEDGPIRGVATLKDDMVDLIWVAIESRGHGIGRALLGEAEKALLERGIQVGRLECFAQNARAIAFYERMDWSRKDTYLDESTGVNKVRMVKQLGRH
ncbi:MAG: GNAT family N-acetyltransferase [Planctomycetota bacterium]|jgi:ribosomal protein S18 acetylase RimI-like enzyme